MRILLTGAGGFLGRQFLGAHGADHDVTPVTRATADLSNDDLEACLPGRAFDAVVHLAGRLLGSSAELRRDNLETARAVVAWALRRGVSRLVFASTAAVYGDACEAPAPETAPTRPTGDYAGAKLEAESAFTQAARSGCSVAILRFPHLYGPGKTVGVAARILEAVRAGHPVVLDGTGEEKRDFLFVSDAARALAMALGLPATPGVNLFNIGTGRSLTLREAVAVFGEACGVNVAVELTGRPAGSPHCIRLDVRSAREHLGWQATVSLEEGVRLWLD